MSTSDADVALNRFSVLQLVKSHAWRAAALTTAALIAVPANAQPAELLIQVIPRIGLFDPLLFVGAPSRAATPDRQAERLRDEHVNRFVDPRRWKPLLYDEYINGIDQSLKSILPAPIEIGINKWNGFEILTGFAPNIGYARRTAIVTIKNPPAGKVTDCSLQVAGKPWTKSRFLDERCTIEIEIGNAATPVSLEYAIDNAARRQTSVGVVPEDFLFVSVGDSYASGEGNPDGAWGNSADTADAGDGRQRSCAKEVDTGLAGLKTLAVRKFSKKDDKTCAPLWMDQRCHRSLWAGPMRAGLILMMNDHQKMGAYTLMSLACSGATIANGLRGPYKDTPTTYRDLQQQFPGRGILPFDSQVNATAAGEAQIHSQVEVTLRETLSRDHGGKRHVDVLAVSIGGNDIGFADVLTDIFSGEVSSRSQAIVESWKATALGDLTNNYFPQLARSIAELDVRQVVLTEYPDPTRRAPADKGEKICSPDADEARRRALFCNGPLMAGWVSEKATAAMGNALEISESQFSHCAVVSRLSGALSEAARKNGWLFVGGIAESFVGKGWCAENETAPSFWQSAWTAMTSTFSSDSPKIGIYSKRDRWFRRADESLAFQGSVHGTMHPTWQGHDVYGRMIAAAAAESVTKVLTVTFSNQAAIKGSVTYLKPPLAVQLRQLGNAPPLDRTNSDHACLVANSTAAEAARCRACLPEATGDTSVCTWSGSFEQEIPVTAASVVRAMHSDTKRVVLKPVLDALQPGTTALRFDGSAPVFKQREYVSRSGRPCKDWISTDCDLHLTFADDESGVRASQASLRVCPSGGASDWKDCAPLAGTPAVVSTLPATSSHALVISAAGHASSRLVKVEVQTSDWLENTATYAPFDTRFDLEAPKLLSLEAHGSALFPSRVNGSAAIPIYPGYMPKLFANISDDLSGPARASLTLLDNRLAVPVPVTRQGDVLRAELSIPLSMDMAGEARSYSFELGAADSAGNEAPVATFRVIPLPLTMQLSGTGRSTPDWIRDQGPDATLLFQRIKLMSNQFNDPLAPDDQRWPLLSAWLNIASGLVRTTLPLPRVVAADCALADGSASTTLWEVLQLADECMARFPARLADLSRSFGEVLKEQNKWCRRETSQCGLN